MAFQGKKTADLICFVATIGTTGDVLPLVTLAAVLKRRGYRIRFLGNVQYRGVAEAQGIESDEWIDASAMSMTDLFKTPGGYRLLWRLPPTLQTLREFWRFNQQVLDELTTRFNAFLQVVGGPDNPAIAAVIGPLNAWKYLHHFGPNCPKIISNPMPYQPSAEFSLARSSFLAQNKVGIAFYNRFLHPQLTGSGDRKRFVHQTYHLVSASPRFFPRPRDWLSNMQVTGYVFPPERAPWTPSAALEQFLAVGEAPVYIGWGSFPYFAGQRGQALLQKIIHATAKTGVRVLLQGISADTRLPDHVHVLADYVPYRWLFPRCRAVVHHGGYGTIHAALSAGKPMVVYPSQADQFYWARRLGQLGVGPGSTRALQRVRTADLIRDLQFVTSARVEAAAQAWTRLLADEDGLAMQVASIEHIIAHHRDQGVPVEWRPRAGMLADTGL